MNKQKWIQEHLQQGELYAGIILGKGDAPDHHVFLRPGDMDGLDWATAKTFAVEAGGDLPTREEQALLYANLKEHFQPTWYWSSTPYAAAPGRAWIQYVYYCGQLSNNVSGRCRARAVRRLTIL